MKILVLNASPKNTRSNTIKLTNAFLSGILDETTAEVHQIAVSDLDIGYCKGCFSCWNKTPGKCCIHDDMEQIISEELWADIIIWSFPLYYFSVPGKLKNLIDRQLPMVLPYMVEREDGIGCGSHPDRYDMSGKRHVLISTCGFYSAEKNYDSVLSMFNHNYGSGVCESIFCGQGELFSIPEVSKRTDEYLGYVRCAGREYVHGDISAETRDKLNTLLYPKNVYEAMADASWGLNEASAENNKNKTKADGRKTEASIFTCQMALLYNPDVYDGTDKVLEMRYTDIEETYQIVLGNDRAVVLEKSDQTPTTTVSTPFSVWQSIARGEISGSQALCDHLFSVSGDFSLMMNWDKYFTPAPFSSSTSKQPDTACKKRGFPIHLSDKKPLLLNNILPFVVYWVAVPIDAFIGSLISLGACALLPLIFLRSEKTIYDVAALSLVTILSVLTLTGLPSVTLLVFSYVLCGLMWLLSCLTKIPVSALYVMDKYFGEKALDNPIFMKTNYSIVAAWGFTYLVNAGIVYGISQTALSSFTGLFGTALCIVTGVFTVWFQKYYPAKIAGCKVC